MKIQLIFLICSIYAASCTPDFPKANFQKKYLREFPKKIVVTEGNQHEFGLPLGTVLKRDGRTGLYNPPPLSDDFDPEARLEIQFGNEVTRRNFCRVGPSVDGTRIARKFYWSQFCRNSDGEDICCGKTKCSCDTFENNCACVSKETFEHFEQKKQVDFNKTIAGIDAAGNFIGKVGPLIAGGK